MRGMTVSLDKLVKSLLACPASWKKSSKLMESMLVKLILFKYSSYVDLAVSKVASRVKLAYSSELIKDN
jgi:hypothetical protein